MVANLKDYLGHATKNQVSCVYVVPAKYVKDRTCINLTLKRDGYEKSHRGNDIIPFREAINFCLLECGALVPVHIVHDHIVQARVGS